jgi:hypothetical protein
MIPSAPRLTIRVHPGELAVARLGPDEEIPPWIPNRPVGFLSLTLTPTECSIVCPADRVPDDVRAERGWRVLEVEGPLPFELTGVLASIAGPLAKAGVNLFVVSTFDTDYVLVPGGLLDRAVEVLTCAGHLVRPSQESDGLCD